MIERFASRVPLLVFLNRLPPFVTIALASFFLYLYTLAPDVLASDGGEFQFAAWNFSFVHPTGYPLFLIAGGIFQHLFPIGNPAFRLNVFNAIIAACAVGGFYLATNALIQDRAAAIIAAASFAVSRTFWFNASGVEAYALNALFLALLIFLAVRWRQHRNARVFAAFCFVFGLALTHHRAIALWIPAFIIFFAITLRQKNLLRTTQPVTRFLLFAFAFCLPLLLYLYIPLRAPTAPYYQLPITNNSVITLYNNSLPGFVNYVLGRTFAYELGWDATSAARLAMTPWLLLDQFGAIGLLLGALGLLAMIWRRDWAVLALTVLGFSATILFNAIYHIGDIFDYYIPAYLAWAVWIGAAISDFRHLPLRAVQGFQFSDFKNPISNLQSLVSNYQLPITILIGLLLVGSPFLTNFSFADRSRENPRAQWMKILSVPIPQNAILISNDRDEMMPLWYIQYVEKTRPDLLGLFPLITPDPQYANVGRLTDSVLDSGRPIFFIKPMPGVEIKYQVEASTPPLVRVLGRAAENAPQHSSNAIIAESLRVLGYDVAREGNALRVAVYWQAQKKLNRNYTAYVNLVSVHGGKIAQGNDHQVGGDFYPTALWDVGEILRDEQMIPLADDSPGTYRLFAGMYTQPSLDPFGDAAEIGIVEIQ